MSRILRDERSYYDPSFARWRAAPRRNSTGDLKEPRSEIAHKVHSLNPFNGLQGHYSSLANLATPNLATPSIIGNMSTNSQQNNAYTATNTIEPTEQTSFTTCAEYSTMDTQQQNITLTPAYYQARAARRAQYELTSHSVSTSLNQSCNTTIPHIEIGSFDNMHDISNCYIATKNAHDKHQNITASFDPATLTCVSCTPHSINK